MSALDLTSNERPQLMAVTHDEGEEEGEEAPGRSPPPFLGEYSITRQITEG
jgi:hypothetical protein